MARSSSVTRKPARTRSRAPKRAKPSHTLPLTRAAVVQAVRREPLGHVLVEKLLYASGFTGTIATDDATLTAYSTDESIFSIRPQVVLRPKHARDVAIAVSVISKETGRFPSLSLTPRAAGTGLSGGSLTDSIVLDVCAHLTNIEAVTLKNGTATITCEPGAMWRDVEARLAENGLYIPSYPASKQLCSVGGAVANNAAGPDSLRYGPVAAWVDSLEVVLEDGNPYTVAPLTKKAFNALVTEDHAYARIAREVFALIAQHETTITRARPTTSKNTAGYALWDILDVSVKEWKRGIGTFDLTKLFTGSQGTIGIITKITLRAAPIPAATSLVAVPLFDLATAGSVIETALRFNPTNVEVFDDLTFELALKNPNFFRERLTGAPYYKAMFALYTSYHVRYRGKAPVITLLITFDRDRMTDERLASAVGALRAIEGSKARLVSNPYEAEMLWQIRHASYTLSKLMDPKKRPAAFLEDMVVPPERLAPFLAGIKRLLKKYHVTAAVHGHGGNGHFHFYPLLDFTKKSTPALIEKMADEFFALAVKNEGSLCGEHNDGIIRTPHLNKMFSKNVLALFKEVEHICDPQDIFNPGKKVNPRFDIKHSIRHSN